MTLYFDASAFGILVFDNDGRQPLEELISSGEPCIMSDFGWGEFASAISIQLRVGSASTDEALAFLASATDLVGAWTRERLRSADVDLATSLVLRFDLALRLPDALHIAIARRIGATLATADTRQAAAARAIGVSVFNPLEDPR